MNDLLGRLDAVGLAGLIAAGDASPREVIEATLARIQHLDPGVNAVIHLLDEKALAVASSDELPDGPFRGVPMLLKDLSPTSAGDPLHLGMKAMRDADYRHPEDSNLVSLYRQAGFVIVGRTNTPELGLIATTEPEAYGPSRNPWDVDYSTGGSSGGAAAAVASGMVPMANASDGGGSIRIPSAHCGLFGLKPSRGRISQGPANEEWGLSVPHLVSHTVRDSAAILDISAVPFPGDGVIAPPPPDGRSYLDHASTAPGRLRIGVVTTNVFAPVDQSCSGATKRMASLLSELGHDVEEAHPSVLDDEQIIDRFQALWAAGAQKAVVDVGETLGRTLSEDDVEPATWLLAMGGATITSLNLLQSLDALHDYRRAMAGWWAEGWDLLLTPTTAEPPPRLGELTSTPDDPLRPFERSVPYAVFTAPFNGTGQPAMSIPAGFTTDGLPLGAQLVAAYGREDLLFQVAGQLEAALRWADHRAPMHP